MIYARRQLQALVRRCARVTGPFDPRECPSVDTVQPKPHVAAPGVGSHVRHSHIGHTYLDGLVGTSGRIERDEGARADLIEPDEPVRADSELIHERSLACRWEFPSLDGGTVKDADDTAVERPPVRGCRITREPDLACVYEHRVYKSNLPGEGELPTATGHRVDAANAAVLRSRIPDDACRIHGDAMGIGAC